MLFFFNFHWLLEVYRVHGFEPFPGFKIFRDVLFLNLKFSGSHIASEVKAQETILNAIRADAPKSIHTGEGMWTFSTSIVSSLGECMLASGLVKSTLKAAPGATKQYSYDRWILSTPFSQRATLVLGAGGEQGACPRKNVSGRDTGNQNV